ncbi:Transcriptional activator [Fusarium falciforme]|nr:Transcriptional activator [Fusarium falciforme]
MNNPYLFHHSIPSISQAHIPETKPAETEETPLYVNAKQFHRIIKRRVARQKLEERYKSHRKPYLHESRHNHAMRRPRGPGGRFLTKEELAATERDQGHVNGVEMDGDRQ